MAQTLIYSIPLLGIIGLIFAFMRAAWVGKKDPGSERMRAIAEHIQVGAMAFLRAEYRVLAVFVLCVSALLFLSGSMSKDASPWTAGAFITGAFCSALAGYVGMRVATKANVRATNAARKGLGPALEIAFAGGSVMGMGVVGLCLLGLGVVFLLCFQFMGSSPERLHQTMSIVTGFSFGASSIALFARVGGGIYTKAADVGADLVGKVEAGIPEDHPLNPATIADNVGDNVGDVAGMGADLFESYAGAIVGTMVLGAELAAHKEFEGSFGGLSAVLLPLVLCGAGVLTSILGSMMVRVKENGNPQAALNLGNFVSSGILLGIMFALVKWMLPTSWVILGVTYTSNGVAGAIAAGLIGGLAIGKLTEYYTGGGGKPVLSIVRQSLTGTATNIIAGLGVGMMSTALPTIVLAASIVAAFSFAGLYGVAIAAVGMLANTGIQLAVDAYGPISDNAGGIAEMSGQPKEVRQRTDKLDAVGNTTAAIGKGFAIASAALTALALFSAFRSAYNATHTVPLSTIDILNPWVVAALFVGAMMPFLFSALAMNAVGRAAMAMIHEVRHQFATIPQLKAALEVMRRNPGKRTDELPEADRKIFEAADGKAEYGRCVEISTKSAIRQMTLPGLLAVVVPVIVGFSFGQHSAEMLGGLLAGVTVSGVLMALFQANAGGAWDNAKKMFEEGVEIDGQKHFKGSEAHKAAVVGDTVGDPFKDTSGPSINILIKLMSVVALVIAGLIP